MNWDCFGGRVTRISLPAPSACLGPGGGLERVVGLGELLIGKA
jgi:hypothetical protein